MPILLSDEEIARIWAEARPIEESDRDIAKARLKKVVEFLDYYETTLQLALDETHTRFDMPAEKWQALKKEAGL